MADWLLLIHQLPPTPSYLRVKVARRMQRIGAVAIKNTVYALPAGDGTLEDFQWSVREIRADGGEANLFDARVIEGLTDAQIQQMFNEARDAEYDEIVSEAQAVDREDRQRLPAEIARLNKRLDEVRSIDFFGAAKGHVATTAVRELQQAAAQEREGGDSSKEGSIRGRTWVTRAGVHVDRMSSAWLIRRFIDPEARFKFVGQKQYAPGSDEVRFDMFDAEFTHEGERCTFEVLLDRMHLEDDALCAIGEVVHDIDLKENRFDRPETAGIAAVIAAIAMAHPSDQERIARASDLLEDLYVYYQKKR